MTKLVLGVAIAVLVLVAYSTVPAIFRTGPVQADTAQASSLEAIRVRQIYLPDWNCGVDLVETSSDVAARQPAISAASSDFDSATHWSIITYRTKTRPNWASISVNDFPRLSEEWVYYSDDCPLASQ